MACTIDIIFIVTATGYITGSANAKNVILLRRIYQLVPVSLLFMEYNIHN